MSIKYKVVKQVFGFDQTQTPKYVARTVTGEMLPFDKVCLQVSQICGTHRALTHLIIGGLLDVMVNHLDMGHSIKLGEFGVLRPGIRAKAQNEEEAAGAQTIYRRRVIFVPGKMLKNFLNEVAVTRAEVLNVDYTGGSGGSGTGGNDGGGGDEPDPDA